MKISKKWKLHVLGTTLAALCFVVFLFHGCGSDPYKVAETSTAATAQASLLCSGVAAGVTSSVVINDGAVSTQSTNVTLTLHAEDTDNVAAYYVSESATSPLADDAGWVAITDSPCAVFDVSNVAFQISAAPSVGSFPRTVYVWFKDGIGNISPSTSDSINLIKAATGC